MKSRNLILVVLVLGAGVYWLPGPGPEQQAIAAKDLPRIVEAPAPRVVAEPRRAAVQRPLSEDAWSVRAQVAHAVDAGPPIVAKPPAGFALPEEPQWYQIEAKARMEKFIKEAGLTEEQRLKLVSALYDIHLNWTSAAMAEVDVQLQALDDPTDGGEYDALAQSVIAVRREGLRSIKEILIPEQFQRFNTEFGALIDNVAGSLEYVTDAGEVLSPLADLHRSRR